SAFAIGEVSAGPGAIASAALEATPAPGGSAGASGGPAASGPPHAVTVAAKDIQFVDTSFSAPAGTPFGLEFDNQDAGVPHNIDIKDSAGTSVFKGEIFPGAAKKVYEVPALPAGSYTYVCDVHPTMKGTATLQ